MHVQNRPDAETWSYGDLRINLKFNRELWTILSERILSYPIDQ